MNLEGLGGKKLSANQVINLLNLSPLPWEGGFFRKLYEAKEKIVVMREGAKRERFTGTAIYYLITPKEFSALHRVKSDEVFHFYQGAAVELIQFGSDGLLLSTRLGHDLAHGEVPQVIVPAGQWQGLRLVGDDPWALLGTCVFPGFDYEDFELGEREKLLQDFPSLQETILAFTREGDS